MGSHGVYEYYQRQRFRDTTIILPEPLPPLKIELETECKSKIKAKAPSILSRYQPTKARLLVKVSAVNACVDELKTQSVKDLRKCIFVRIVLVGPSVEDQDNVCPGALIAIDKNSGQKLEKLSSFEKREYRMIKESHIVAYADF